MGGEGRPRNAGTRRTALVHDWLTGMRGGEKCLRVLCDLLPEADLFTLLHLEGRLDPVIEARRPRTSFLQSLPGVGRYYRHLLPLFPLAVEGLEVQDYPLILSLSHCVAKGVIPGPGSLHVCYCFTPMRYVWDLYGVYFGGRGPSAAPRPLTRLVAHYLRLWDVATSGRVDRFVANSRFVAARIRRYYGRRSKIIYPPVEWDRFAPVPRPEADYYLVVSADAPYKRLDLALEAFARNGRRLKVAGKVPCWAEGRRGRREIPSNVELLGWKSDAELRDLYAHCRALVFPGIEDFGIVPVEAQAAGRPVIAFGKGGVLETVRGLSVAAARGMDVVEWRRGGYTGLFFPEPTGASLADAVACFEALEEGFEPETIRRWAKRFERPAFERAWRDLLAEVLEEGDGSAGGGGRLKTPGATIILGRP